ncbi:MAG TPA: hypothetical protein VHT75_14080 [Acidimicrobiales bacterium]|nr:hypothetical protein [Acidimicrobiales bacterium]
MGPWRRVTAIALLPLVAILLMVLGAPRRGNTSAAANGEWSVTVTPTTVVDGQTVKILLKAFSGFSISYMEIRMCQNNVSLSSGVPATGLAPPKDFSSGCTRNPISSSATGAGFDSKPSIDNASTADGEPFLYRVGTGTVQYFDGDGNQHTLTCDGSDPCSLGVELLVVPDGQQAHWENFVQPLTFGSNDPIAGCGGPAAGVLSSGGSDRMTEDWINWSLAECVLPGRHGAATRSSFVGEGEAISSFAAGGLDIAYSASGYDSAVSLFTGTPRPAVAVPFALNASVLGVIANQTVNGHQVPVTGVNLTLPEIAGILNGGTFGEAAYDTSIRTRNPQLGSVFGPAYGQTALAYPGADSNTWYLTRMLSDLAPKDWVVPKPAAGQNVLDPNAGRARGITNSFAAADPSFSSKIGNYLTLANGRPSVIKVIASQQAFAVGDFWMATDLETANALGLTPVGVETKPGSGSFQLPDQTSMTNAVSAMVPDANGLLIGADPKSLAASTSAANAYPLTYVEYAMVPTQPLLNDDCTARTTSQSLLTAWLQYITGPGQAGLGAGMVPITADLKTAAGKAIASVGTAPVNAQSPVVTPSGQTCTAIAQPTPTTTASTAAPTTRATTPSTPSPTSPNVLATPGTVPAVTGQPNGAPAPIGGGTSTPSAATTSTLPTQIALPAFAGMSPFGYGGTVAALIGLIGLSALAAVTRTDPGRAAWRRVAVRLSFGRSSGRPPNSS